MIVGATGSGKTGLGIKIAQAIGGEIISADSRAIYQGMDLGTAKPTLAEREGIVHHGFDLVRPGERFTVAQFCQLARQWIIEIQKREKIPIIVGGTGLYVDALIYDYNFSVQSKILQTDRAHMNTKFKVFGINWERTMLRSRLKERIDKMFTEELIIEYQHLKNVYSDLKIISKTNIYDVVERYLNGELSFEEAKERAFYLDWRLARRQLTWFRRNEQIIWLPLDQIYSSVLKLVQDDKGK